MGNWIQVHAKYVPKKVLLMTTAPCCHHVFVIFKNHILFVIKVEEIEGFQFIRNTARCADILRQFKCMDYGLHSGMVCCILTFPQREKTRSSAVKCIVSTWVNNPSWPANSMEVNVEFPSMACCYVAFGGRHCCSPRSPAPACIAVFNDLRFMRHT